ADGHGWPSRDLGGVHASRLRGPWARAAAARTSRQRHLRFGCNSIPAREPEQHASACAVRGEWLSRAADDRVLVARAVTCNDSVGARVARDRTRRLWRLSYAATG